MDANIIQVHAGIRDLGLFQNAPGHLKPNPQLSAFMINFMSPALLLDIKSLDYRNVTDVAGYGLLLISYADRLGLGVGEEPTIGTRTQIMKLAAQWCAGVERSMAQMTAGEALDILEIYDLVQRVVRYREPAPDFVFRCVDRALSSRFHGDKSIDPYKLYDRISTGLRCKEKAYYGRPIDWNLMMLDGWHNEFLSGQYAGFTPATDYDIISRVAILLTADLSAFELDAEAYKRRLFDNHRRYLEEVAEVYENWSAEQELDYNSKTIEAISRFLQAARPLLEADEYARYHAATLSALYDKSNSPYHRAAISLPHSVTPSPSPIPAA